MSNSQGRPLFRIIIQNFINSLKPRSSGDVIGKDYLGNTYYEAKHGHRKASRWFEPAEKDNFEAEMPAEWESWLRHRRREAPSEEEIARNLAIMKLKRENGARLERERVAAGGALPTAPAKGRESFPTYPGHYSDK